MRVTTLLAGLTSAAPFVSAQAALGGGAPPPTTTQPAEQYPVTSTVWDNGTPIIFVQTFAAVVDQGPAPITTGAIGLGTISGTVGAVRTGSASYGNAGTKEGGALRERWLVGIIGTLVGVGMLV
jgi:hypothetical protein